MTLTNNQHTCSGQDSLTNNRKITSHTIFYTTLNFYSTKISHNLEYQIHYHIILSQENEVLYKWSLNN